MCLQSTPPSCTNSLSFLIVAISGHHFLGCTHQCVRLLGSHETAAGVTEPACGRICFYCRWMVAGRWCSSVKSTVVVIIDAPPAKCRHRSIHHGRINAPCYSQPFKLSRWEIIHILNRRYKRSTLIRRLIAPACGNCLCFTTPPACAIVHENSQRATNITCTHIVWSSVSQSTIKN